MAAKEHRLTFRLNDDLFERIQKYATNTDTSVSKAIRTMIEKHTKTLDRRG